jgi:hypothetical protein
MAVLFYVSYLRKNLGYKMFTYLTTISTYLTTISTYLTTIPTYLTTISTYLTTIKPSSYSIYHPV